MLRALSTRSRSRHGYDRLGDESKIGLLEGKLERARSVPSTLFNPSKKLGAFSVPVILEEPSVQKKKPPPTTTNGKFSHPIFSLFDRRSRGGNNNNAGSNSRRKKKTTAKPEFSRYMEYLKEGGMWDPNSNMPVIYFK